MGVRKTLASLIVKIRADASDVAPSLDNVKKKAEGAAKSMRDTARSADTATDRLDKMDRTIDRGILGRLDAVRSKFFGVAAGIAGMVAGAAVGVRSVAQLIERMSKLSEAADAADASLARAARAAGQSLEGISQAVSPTAIDSSSLVSAAQSERDKLVEEYAKTLEAAQAERDGVRLALFGNESLAFNIPGLGGSQEDFDARAANAQAKLDRGLERVAQGQREARKRAQEEQDAAQDRFLTEAKIARLKEEGKDLDAAAESEKLRRREFDRQLKKETDREFAELLRGEETKRREAFRRAQNQRVQEEMRAEKEAAEEKKRIAREAAEEERRARLEAIESERQARIESIRRLEDEQRRQLQGLFNQITASVGTFSGVASGAESINRRSLEL